jgi:nicotinamide mononucleotide transporter
MEVFETIFSQYKGYSNTLIFLEITGSILGVVSALYSRVNNILVFPLGIVSTAIFVYLLYDFNLLGDMIINAYYFIMSIFGWYVWTNKKEGAVVTPIGETSNKEWTTTAGIFLAAMVFVYTVYYAFDKFEGSVSYVDILTTGIFFSGMWLMALRKIEYWFVLLVGNIISVPLYIYKGLAFTSILYVILTIIAILGYIKWKKYLNNRLSMA